MPENFENVPCGGNAAPWLNSAAYNNYYTYSYISRSSFYAMISPTYYSFMSRFVRNWLWWNDGYVPYFHNSERGIPSTHIGGSLVDKISKKVVGGRIMFKNSGDDNSVNNANEALIYIGTKWAIDTDFENVVKKATKYAAAAGTSLVKLNKDDKGLWAEALRFDQFICSVGARGNVEDVKCFLQLFTDLGVRNYQEGDSFTGYYVVEYRHFADYKRATGEVIYNAPVVEYAIHRQSGSITNGQYVTQNMAERVPFRDLPKKIRSSIGKAYFGIKFDDPTLLPFADHLGVELVRWTGGVTGLPELPFGESFLSPIIAYLESWDYYYAAANTDMYLGRGRVLVPKQITGKGTDQSQYNSGLDSFIYTQVQTTDPDKQKPTPIQFDLRSTSWSEIRDRLIQDISINTGVNVATIASFLNDSAARTAREISTEENETAEYVNDQRAIIEKPLNRLLSIVTKYYGYTDAVVIRWSSAGLTNRYTNAEIISMGLREGFISRRKAIQMFNFDDDEAQVQQEYKAIMEDQEAAQEQFPDLAFGDNESNPFDFDVKDGGADAENTDGSTGQAE